MLNLGYRVPYLSIVCPHCERKQTVEMDIFTGVWYQTPPFCCDVMRYADDEIWNKRLDKLIHDAQMPIL